MRKVKIRTVLRLSSISFAVFVTFSDDLKTLSSDYIPGWTANGVTARDEVHTTLNFGYASQGTV